MLKELSIRNPIFSKIPFRNEWEIKTFSNKGKLREFVTSRHTLKEWLKRFSKQKGNDKERTLKQQEENNKTRSAQTWVTDFPFQFSKLCLIVEAKIITLSNIVLNVCREKT